MITIKLGNANSKVTNIDKVIKLQLSEALAVKVPGSEYSPKYQEGVWDGKLRFLKWSSFPTGLLDLVLSTLTQLGQDYVIEDSRIQPPSIIVPDKIELGGGITLRDYQLQSVSKAISSARGIINVATNGGKTEIACGIIKCLIPTIEFNLPIAFFTHSKEIFIQTHKRLEKRLGMKVGRIGSGKWEEKQVNVVMIPTVSRHLRTESDKTPRTKDFLSRVICFLGDEVHHASSDSWYEVLMACTQAYYRFGLTGTVDEDQQLNKMKLQSVTGGIIHKISNEFLIKEGHSAKPVIYFIDMSDCDKIPKGDFSWVYDKGIVNNKIRNSKFCDVIEQKVWEDKQSLVIVNHIDHGENVLQELTNRGITTEFTHGGRTSTFREEVLDRFSNGEIPVLIATNILDEGVDLSNINCLFMLSGGKSFRMTLQRVGRGLRVKDGDNVVEVYDALDLFNGYLAEHTLERHDHYKWEGFDIKKLEL